MFAIIVSAEFSSHLPLVLRIFYDRGTSRWANVQLPQSNSNVAVLAIAAGVLASGVIRFQLVQLANVASPPQAGGIGGSGVNNDTGSSAGPKIARFSPYPVTSPRKATMVESVEPSGEGSLQSGKHVADDAPDDVDECASNDGAQTSQESSSASSNTLRSVDATRVASAEAPALASVFASLDEAQIMALLNARTLMQGASIGVPESSRDGSSAVPPFEEDQGGRTRKTRKSKSTSKK
ncbi:hypothetical protein CONPUDRAFT_73880 [Coniophora puteana RWD-64-598 SS2]|uniref:Uncharacterized protein n=1 Tax=Coniophora puteana (strain RWD-64-598) TaxID=741705 RepID=A0A5M3MNX2_CONPW|nr:uncharacterized protein CONPUDRAFT_73880 [Coniophora puteana RWD-64-598 SS2]EIW80868.1 hypothetical protein CONPUDRAFT_73880 [Coniophora puteana RWD-64-598 SS2]